jgi:hypothetical protein
MLGPPGRFVAVDVAVDLRGPGTERPHERRQLLDLAALGVEAEAMGGERRAELGVGGDGGMPDAVDGLEAVPDPDRVQSPPRTRGEDAGVDLQVKVPVGAPAREV